jgi:hypothetical protein
MCCSGRSSRDSALRHLSGPRQLLPRRDVRLPYLRCTRRSRSNARESTREAEFALFTACPTGFRSTDWITPPPRERYFRATCFYFQAGPGSRSVNSADAVEGPHPNQNQNQAHLPLERRNPTSSRAALFPPGFSCCSPRLVHGRGMMRGTGRHRRRKTNATRGMRAHFARRLQGRFAARTGCFGFFVVVSLPPPPPPTPPIHSPHNHITP